ncbi:MAG: hypothetical protein ACHQ50_14940 [Fimbriimonadales bacterium]
MKRTLALIGIALIAGSFASQQGYFSYTDAKKSLTLRAKEFSQTTLPGEVYRFEFSTPGGQVYVASKTQGIEIYAPRVEVDAVRFLSKDMNLIRAASASGGVRAIRSVRDMKTEMRGATAKYQATNPATLNVSGPVTLASFKGDRASFEAAGSSLTADLGGPRSSTPFQTAVLSGPVRIKIRQAAQGSRAPTDMNVSARRLLVNMAVKPNTVTLTGNVHIAGLAGGGTVESALAEVVLYLDDKGEVVKTSGSGGGQ